MHVVNNSFFIVFMHISMLLSLWKTFLKISIHEGKFPLFGLLKKIYLDKIFFQI